MTKNTEKAQIEILSKHYKDHKIDYKEGDLAEFKGFEAEPDEGVEGSLVEGALVRIVKFVPSADPLDSYFQATTDDGKLVDLFPDEIKEPEKIPLEDVKKEIEEEAQEEVKETPKKATKKKSAGTRANAKKPKAAKKDTTKKEAEGKTKSKAKTKKIKLSDKDDGTVVGKYLKDDLSVKEKDPEVLLESTKSLRESIDDHYFALGGMLAKIHDNAYYTKLGYNDFGDYTENDLGLRYPAAMGRVRVYNKCVELGITAADLKAMGYTKFREVAKYVNTENYKEIVEASEGKSVKDLVDHVKESYVEVQPGEVDTKAKVSYRLTFFEDQANIVKQCLEESKALEGLEPDADAQALFNIVNEWQTMRGMTIGLEEELDLLSSKYDLPQETIIKFKTILGINEKEEVQRPALDEGLHTQETLIEAH